MEWYLLPYYMAIYKKKLVQQYMYMATTWVYPEVGLTALHKGMMQRLTDRKLHAILYLSNQVAQCTEHGIIMF